MIDFLIYRKNHTVEKIQEKDEKAAIKFEKKTDSTPEYDIFLSVIDIREILFFIYKK